MFCVHCYAFLFVNENLDGLVIFFTYGVLIVSGVVLFFYSHLRSISNVCVHVCVCEAGYNEHVLLDFLVLGVLLCCVLK